MPTGFRSRPQCRTECGLQGTQMSGDVRAQMGAERAAVALYEDLEIPSCLGRLHHTEGVLPSRHGHIDGVIARNLQEHARVRATLVALSRRVQEAWSEFKARCDALVVADAMAHRLQHALVRLVHGDVRQQRKVISLADSVEMRCE